LEPGVDLFAESVAGLGRHKVAVHEALFPEVQPLYVLRMVHDGYMTPAWAVSIVADEPGSYHVEHRVAASSCRSENTPRSETAAPGPSIRTCPISTKTVVAVASVWEAIVSGARYPTVSYLGLDGFVAYFSCFPSLVWPERSDLMGIRSGKIWTPDPGSIPGRLYSLGVHLSELPSTDEDARLDKEQAIVVEAEELLKEAQTVYEE